MHGRQRVEKGKARFVVTLLGRIGVSGQEMLDPELRADHINHPARAWDDLAGRVAEGFGKLRQQVFANRAVACAIVKVHSCLSCVESWRGLLRVDGHHYGAVHRKIGAGLVSFCQELSCKWLNIIGLIVGIFCAYTMTHCCHGALSPWGQPMLASTASIYFETNFDCPEKALADYR